MIGTKKITDKIISDAENDAREKLAAAEDECEAIRADYEKRASELRAKLTAEAELEAEVRIERTKAACAALKKNAELRAKGEAVDAAFEAAAAEIRSMEPEKYRDLLVGLIEGALVAQISAEAEELKNYGETELFTYDSFEIAMNKADLAAHGAEVLNGVRRASIGRLDQSVLEKLKLSKTPADIDGGVVIKYGEMEINCSLSMIFAGLREELEGEVYGILFNQN